MLDLIYLTSDVMLVGILFLEIPDEAKILFLYFCNCFRGSDQISYEVWFDFVRFCLIESDVFKLLVIVCALMLLSCVYFSDDRVDLAIELLSEFDKVDSLPHLGSWA